VRSTVKVLLPLALFMAGTLSAWAIESNGVSVNVEAMIGQATLVRELADGKKDAVVVPTGQTTQRDPTTGQILLTPATIANRVNEVVQAIAASSPDAADRLPDDEGCSEDEEPLRLNANPEYDEAVAAFIAEQLKAMSSGELMMVIAVLINNANHLCIDSTTVANTIALIISLRPDEADNILLVASLLDPDNIDRWRNAVTPGYRNPPRGNPRPPLVPERDIPPGGSVGEPPSPE
jgi:hypothetical protein